MGLIDFCAVFETGIEEKTYAKPQGREDPKLTLTTGFSGRHRTPATLRFFTIIFLHFSTHYYIMPLTYFVGFVN
jgi:hypothetical protein